VLSGLAAGRAAAVRESDAAPASTLRVAAEEPAIVAAASRSRERR
jgi:hypothetical protein